MEGALPRLERLSNHTSVMDIKTLIYNRFKDSLSEDMENEVFLNTNM